MDDPGLPIVRRAGIIGCLSIFLFPVCFILLVASYPDLSFTRSQPKEVDLIGHYVPNQKTRELILGRMGYSHADSWIDIKADGTFVIHEMPGVWRDAWNYKGTYENGEGDWKLYHYIGTSLEYWSLGFDFEPHVFAADDVYLVGQGAPYVLYFYIGDPDNGEGLEFERVATSP